MSLTIFSFSFQDPDYSLISGKRKDKNQALTYFNQFNFKNIPILINYLSVVQPVNIKGINHSILNDDCGAA